MQLRNQILFAVIVIAIFIIQWMHRPDNQSRSPGVTSHTLASDAHSVPKSNDKMVYGGGGGDGPEVDFKIANIRRGQSFHSEAPFVRDGGDWTFFDCSVTSDPQASFTFGFESPSKKDEMISFGRAAMFVPDRIAGASLTTVFGREFKTSIPPAEKPEPLAAATIEWAVFGENLSPNLSASPSGNWTAGKLFLQEPGVEAEVFFNFDLIDGVGRFSEKDEDYRSDLVFYIMEHFRDGTRTKRTPDEDPNLTTNGPSFKFSGSIARSKDCEFGFLPCNDRIWLADRNPGGELRLVSLDGPQQEVSVGHFDGVISPHPLNPRGDRLIVDEQIQSMPNAYSSDDEHRLWLIDELTGERKQLSGPWGKFGSVDSISEDGRFIAVSGRSQSSTRKSATVLSTYFMDLQEGNIVKSDFGGTTSAWTGSGESTQALLERWSHESGRMEYSRSVAATTGISASIAPDSLPFRLTAGASPDGTLKIIVRPGESMKIQRLDGSTVGQFIFHPDDVHFATAESISWCGSQYLQFAGRYPAVINVATMKMSYLPDELSATNHFQFSSDFKWAAIDEKDGLHICRISQPEVAASQP